MGLGDMDLFTQSDHSCRLLEVERSPVPRPPEPVACLESGTLLVTVAIGLETQAHLVQLSGVHPNMQLSQPAHSVTVHVHSATNLKESTP